MYEKREKQFKSSENRECLTCLGDELGSKAFAARRLVNRHAPERVVLLRQQVTKSSWLGV
jgi:hypothetical protein